MSNDKMIKVTVFRFDPDVDETPHYETYQVPGGSGVMVLDALNFIRENYDPTLRFRHSCHMGKCGSCAVMVNGRPCLACWELAEAGMLIEPLRGFPIVADLVVDRVEDDLQAEDLVFERKSPVVTHGQPEQLPIPYQKQLDECRTCINCFSCVSACPYIYAEEKVFIGPKQMVEIARHAYDPRQDEKQPLQIAFHHGVWDCVACQACTSICPQEIDPRQRIIDLRAMLMERPTLQGLPRQIKRLNESLFTLHNPYHYPIKDKGNWAEGLGLKDLSQGEKADWLYFAGCAQSYDPSDQAVARGLTELFRLAGLDFGIMGQEENCCGDPSRFTGEEGLYEYIRDQNAEAFDKYGVTKVITTCPHGFNRFLEDWGDTSRTVRHYTQVLAELIRQGRLKFSREVKRTVTYHDSCYLGRYNGVYDEPRSVLQAIPGLKLVEMKDNRERSLCCGGGGGGAFLDIKVKPRLSLVRVRQAIEAGAEIIAVACPFCRTTLDEAAKNLEAGLEVKHVAELVSQAL
jgi:succinate dehydrogenase/fumarate reductase iron-sulfur protein